MVGLLHLLILALLGLFGANTYFAEGPSLFVDIMAEFSAAEIQKLAQSFQELGVKPKADNANDLQEWMEAYVQQSGPKQKEVHIHAQLPRVTIFSGEKKTDHASFDVWKYEINCLRKEGTHSEAEIYQSARRSLRGEASRIAMRLGPDVKIEQLILKLEGIYGIVEAGENLLAQFYGARQREGEDVTSWGCRLEDLAQKAVEQGCVSEQQLNQMLHNQFWMGLQQQVKDATRHNYENITDFDKLRVQIRKVEHELSLSKNTEVGKKEKKQAHVKMSSTEKQCDSSEELQELKKIVCSLSAKVDQLVNKPDASPETAASQFHPTDGATYDFPQYVRGRGRPRFGSRRGYERYGGGRGNRGRQPLNDNQPQCYRCGQVGHLWKGCRANLDSMQQPLNWP